MESKNTVKAIKLMAAGFILAPSLAMADSSALVELKTTAGSDAAVQTAGAPMAVAALDMGADRLVQPARSKPCGAMSDADQATVKRAVALIGSGDPKAIALISQADLVTTVREEDQLEACLQEGLAHVEGTLGAPYKGLACQVLTKEDAATADRVGSLIYSGDSNAISLISREDLVTTAQGEYQIVECLQEGIAKVQAALGN
jgi:hypothetical protein